jgi:hypothetical protein
MTIDHQTGEELGCPKCHMFGCSCSEVCSACKRNHAACICKSHAPAPAVPLSVSGDPIPGRNVKALVSEGMRYYYERDAKGLERLIRRLVTP